MSSGLFNISLNLIYTSGPYEGVEYPWEGRNIDMSLHKRSSYMTLSEYLLIHLSSSIYIVQMTQQGKKQNVWGLLPCAVLICRIFAPQFMVILPSQSSKLFYSQYHKITKSFLNFLVLLLSYFLKFIFHIFLVSWNIGKQL
jgi:hypothetical protein